MGGSSVCLEHPEREEQEWGEISKGSRMTADMNLAKNFPCILFIDTACEASWFLQKSISPAQYTSKHEMPLSSAIASSFYHMRA